MYVDCFGKSLVSTEWICEQPSDKDLVNAGREGCAPYTFDIAYCALPKIGGYILRKYCLIYFNTYGDCNRRRSDSSLCTGDDVIFCLININ